MKEFDRIFFSQPMAWREGFFYAIDCRDNADYFQDCVNDLSPSEKEPFTQGWQYAVHLHKEHTKRLNES